MAKNIVYFLEGKPYINLTNACTNRCLFCIRDIKDDVVGANLWLDLDNVTIDDVIEQLNSNKDKIRDEITYCGYGEPTLRYDVLLKSAKYIKENFKDIKIRLNTNGHGSFVNKKNIVPEIKGLIDEVSISLNAQNENMYNRISKPKVEDAYQIMLDFARECVKEGIKTKMTIVVGFQNFNIDVNECKKIAQEIGAEFRVREFIEEGY